MPVAFNSSFSILNSQFLIRMSSRLSTVPAAALVNRSKPLTFEYNGRRIEGCEGDTVASALAAAGVEVLSRSFKYHRPRGLLCGEGHCPNCMMNVDGSPNVRICTEKACNGMVVKHQNAETLPFCQGVLPAPEFDRLSVLGWFSFLMPAGFYYKVMHRPRFMWPVFEHFIRKVAGLGVVNPKETPPYRYERQHLRTDVAVVGGGPAGLCAALAAAEAGASVTLVERDSFLGGHLRFQHPDSAGFKKAAELEKQVRANKGIRVLTGAVAFGLYEGNMMGIVQGRREIRLRTKRVVVASGIIERSTVFGDNDRPGIMLGRGVQRLLHLYGVKPGKRAVVVGSNDRALDVAADLLRAGIEVAAYADHRDRIPDGDAVRLLREKGVLILTSETAVTTSGGMRIQSVTLGPISGRGERRTVDCDLLVLSTGGDPALHLVQQAGARGVFEEHRQEFLAKRVAEGHFVAGDSNGVHGEDAILLDGRRAGLAAAQGIGTADHAAAIAELDAKLTAMPSVSLNPNGMVGPEGGGKRFVCVCEDVTEKDVCDAVREGFDGIETLKRYSTISMGPCQGKMCQMSAIGICARETNRTIEETGSTVSRPPYTPITLGALTGRNYHPHKTVATHSRHAALNAKVINLGDWLRPEMYTDSADESKAVHERVGLIDVSTLGRIDLRGPDVVKLLDKVYINSWGNLKVGRTRYGVMCDDSGIIFDDGTCARLGDQHYYMTTTTSGVENAYQWLTSWLAGSSLDVCVTNVTSAYGGVNLAGPRSREVLRKLTSLNLDSKEFPYLGCAQAQVAGVPCILFRIGFVGEMGYEIHFPSSYGDYMWDVVMDAGKEFDIRPFGVETQRILRLQKGHIIVGQDTDALTNPLEANMGWAVKFDKPDFIGRRAIAESKKLGIKKSLVGFVTRDGRVPEEGCQVMENGFSIGRVTSSRFSPHLRKSIGLAWVPTPKAKSGQPILIRSKGEWLFADVVTEPFYDPQGGRMKA